MPAKLRHFLLKAMRIFSTNFYGGRRLETYPRNYVLIRFIIIDKVYLLCQRLTLQSLYIDDFHNLVHKPPKSSLVGFFK